MKALLTMPLLVLALLAAGHGAEMSKPGGKPNIDQARSIWSDVSFLDLPDKDHFFCLIGGAARRVNLPSGDTLWPIYFMDRAARAAYPKCGYSATIVRCRFGGQKTKYAEHGDELAAADPRGFCEPSLTQFNGRFFRLFTIPAVVPA